MHLRDVAPPPRAAATSRVPRANAALYLWLAAAAVALKDQTPSDPEDPLQADLAAIATAQAMTETALQTAPGFRKLHSDLCEATLFFRRQISLETAISASSNRDELQEMINRGVGVVAGAGMSRPGTPGAALRPGRPGGQ